MQYKNELEAINDAIDLWIWLINYFPARKTEHLDYMAKYKNIRGQCPCCEYWRTSCYLCPLEPSHLCAGGKGSAWHAWVNTKWSVRLIIQEKGLQGARTILKALEDRKIFLIKKEAIR